MPLIYSVNGVRHAEFSTLFEEALRKRARPMEQTPNHEAASSSESREKNPYHHQQQPLSPKQRDPVLRAEQIMTRPAHTLRANQRMTDAETLMDAKRFRHVPIVDERGGLLGIVSDRDLLRFKGNWDDAIQNHMTPNVLTATPDTTIAKIAQAMFENRMNSLPIVDENHKVVGILTSSDIFRSIMNHAPLDLWV